MFKVYLSSFLHTLERSTNFEVGMKGALGVIRFELGPLKPHLIIWDDVNCKHDLPMYCKKSEILQSWLQIDYRSKMKHTLPDYMYWYCPSDKNRLQWTGRNFMATFSLSWLKKGYFCHQRHKILNFETENMVKNGANSTRLCVLILPFS